MTHRWRFDFVDEYFSRVDWTPEMVRDYEMSIAYGWGRADQRAYDAAQEAAALTRALGGPNTTDLREAVDQHVRQVEQRRRRQAADREARDAYRSQLERENAELRQQVADLQAQLREAIARLRTAAA